MNIIEDCYILGHMWLWAIMWMLGTEPWVLCKNISALNLWAISPDPKTCFLKKLYIYRKGSKLREGIWVVHFICIQPIQGSELTTSFHGLSVVPAYSVSLGQDLYIPVLSWCMDPSSESRGRVVTAVSIWKDRVGDGGLGCCCFTMSYAQLLSFT